MYDSVGFVKRVFSIRAKSYTSGRDWVKGTDAVMQSFITAQ
jgi:hypothetical protein